MISHGSHFGNHCSKPFLLVPCVLLTENDCSGKLFCFFCCFFFVSEVLSHLFDLESDTEENVPLTEEDVEEDPNYYASFSDENEIHSVDPPVVF